MTDALDIQNKWLAEKFEHINTILNHVKDSIDKLRDDQSAFICRCDSEMTQMGMRLREIERRHDEMKGGDKNRNELQTRQNLTWQMLIALGGLFSALAAIAGYFMGKA
jgi:hypothetical protein